MWLLKDFTGKLTYIKATETFTVSRRKGSLVLNDDSISRNHAEIRIVPRQDIDEIKDNTEPLSTCMIKDCGSKYGSYILKEDHNDLQLTDAEEKLKHMDKIRFGVQQSIFTLIYVPIITATSGLEKEEREELKSILDTIDGKMTNGWEAFCTHMTVSKPNITEKTILSLISGIPIVPPKYWTFVMKAIQANEEIPEPAEFAKVINDKFSMLGDISVLPNPQRRKLFKDLTFIHFDSNQYNFYCRIIESAGGKSLLYKNRTREIDVCADNVIVMQLVESNTTQATCSGDASYAAVCEELGRCHRRPIPTTEIAIAIFHCSRVKYVNPRHDHANMFRRRAENNVERANVLAADTQDLDAPGPSNRANVASCSVTKNPITSTGESSNSDRYVKESTELESATSSPTVEIISGDTSDSQSRSKDIGNNEKKLSQREIPETQSQLVNNSVATLNSEKNVNDVADIARVTENSLKRNREDDEMIDSCKKKRCEISVDDHRSSDNKTTEKNVNSRNRKNVVSYDDIEFDEEIASIHYQGSQIADAPEFKKKQSDHSKIDGKLESDFSAETKTREIRKNEEEDDNLRKRKTGRTGNSPFSDTGSPLKRVKTSPNFDKKNGKISGKTSSAQTSIMNYFSPKKRSNDKCEWVETEKSIKRDNDFTEFSTSGVNVKTEGGQKTMIKFEDTKYFSNPSITILRVKCPSELTNLEVPTFRKTFRKIYTKIPLRIAMMSRDETFDTITSDVKDIPTKVIQSPEEASTSRKESSKNVTGSKKRFRL